MTDAAPLERDRDLARLLDDTFGLYRRYLGAALAIAAAVVIPVELAVSGVGLGQLSSGYDESNGTEVAAFSSLVSVLVTTPLVTGILVRLAMAGDGEGQGAARRAATEGLERFGPLLGAVLLATLGILLGLIAFVVPGVILAIRWVIVAPVVVVEGHRGAEALRRSAALVSGHAWWVLGVMLVQGVIVGVLGAVIGIPADALAKAADSSVWTLVGTIVAQIVGLPFSAFATALLFFTLRARKEGGRSAPAGGERSTPAPTAAGAPQATGSTPAPAAPGAPPATPAPPPGEGGPPEDDWRPPAARPPTDDPAAGDSPSAGGWEPPVPPR